MKRRQLIGVILLIQFTVMKAGFGQEVTACINVTIRKDIFNSVELPKLSVNKMTHKDLKTDVKLLKP